MKLAAAFILLSACATLPDDLGGAKQSWMGAGYEEVVAAWGPPTRTDGAQHTWVSEDIRRATPSAGVIFGTGVSGIGARMPFGAGEAVRCDRTLVFRDGRVAEASWAGPYDYCSAFRR